METINTFIMRIADPLLGWLLYLPRDLALFVVAMGTALLLTLVRIWTTNQALLLCYKDDKRTLRGLIKEAKKSKDKERLAQLRTTMQQIATRLFIAEGRPLLASLLPIVLMATWCGNRIGFIPPDGTQPIHVQAYGPVLGIDQLVHAVPQEGITAETGWIQRVRETRDADGKIVAGVAEWSLGCARREEPYRLEIRQLGRTITADIAVNGRVYSGPVSAYGKEPFEVVRLVMPEYKLFGVVPGFLGLAPWIIGYLVIVIPLALILKPVLRIR